MSEFNEKVYTIVRSIPRGRVMTYGQIATLLGVPRAAREVGWALHWVEGDSSVPCQRVVNRFGGLASGYGGGQIGHRQDIEAEGVEVRDDYTLDLARYQWQPDAAETEALHLSLDKQHELNAKLPFSHETLSTRRKAAL